MKLYLIRHGETDYNRQGIVQGGGIDSDLNEMGRMQAQAFFDYYQNIRFDAVYMSKLKRTHQTLAPWKKLGYEMTQSAALDEFSWGWMEGKKPNEAMKKEFHQVKDYWQQGHLDKGIEGGETPLSAWDRIKPLFEELPNKHAGQQILICSHGRTSRIILSQLLGHGLNRMAEFDHSNTGLNLLQFTEEGKVVAEKINDISHLNAVRLKG